ncbi:MAG TPA: replication-associated recombination protein A [Gemmatimonadales bacterium]
MTDPSLFAAAGTARPLADSLRPDSLDAFVGQRHLVGPGKPLGDAIRRGEVASMVLWGPPGSGKTTLAGIIARHTAQQFEPFSAVTQGVPRVREIIKGAESRRQLEGRGTILFCDEIHRFNKAQQDAFLPWVERGVITLIGATTENPSFALTGALLSRCRVFVLEPLDPEEIRAVVTRALSHLGTGDGGQVLTDDAIDLLVRFSDGDARRAINGVEAAAAHAVLTGAAVAPDALQDVLARRLPRYDKAGEEHYNLMSALHKAMRGSDVDGALYWLARMVEGGEDLLYIARRVVRAASEDVGLADPRALSIAVAAKEAYHFLGSPEGELAIAEAVVYVATAPKSNRVYQGWQRAVDAARAHPAEPVPLHIRNAPTALMTELGYGKGYRYDHAESEGLAAGQGYLPSPLADAVWYEPTDRGYEKTVAARVRWWAEQRRAARQAEEGTAPGE